MAEDENQSALWLFARHIRTGEPFSSAAEDIILAALQPRAALPAPEQGWRAPRAAFVMEAKDGSGWRVQAGYERKEDAHLVADILSGRKPEQGAE